MRNTGAQNQTYNPCSPAEMREAQHITELKVIQIQLFPKGLIHRLDEHL